MQFVDGKSSEVSILNKKKEIQPSVQHSQLTKLVLFDNKCINTNFQKYNNVKFVFASFAHEVEIRVLRWLVKYHLETKTR